MKKVVCDSKYYVRFASKNINYSNMDINIKNISDNDLKLIFFSSKDTYDSIQKNKNEHDLINTITKYLIRASTRTTPYGALSGVAIGNFGENTSNHCLTRYY